MTQNRARTASEHCSHPSRLEAEQRVPGGIDTRVNQVERPSLKSTSNRPPTNARPKQLSPPHNPMLPLSQRRNRPVHATRLASGPYEVLDARFVFHAPMVDGRDARVVREMSRKCDVKEAPARRYRLWL
jgi:hypothetical protein